MAITDNGSRRVGWGPRARARVHWKFHRLRWAQPTLTSAPPWTGRATPVMNFASSEARNSAALATSQPVPILPRSGTSRVSLRGDLGAAAVAGPRPGVDRHWRVHQPWQDAVSADAVRVVHGSCSVKAIIAAFVAL